MSQPTFERVPATDDVPPDESLATTYLPDASEDEAFRQGYWAYTLGIRLDDNPYRCDRRHDWDDGWMDAAENCEG